MCLHIFDQLSHEVFCIKAEALGIGVKKFVLEIFLHGGDERSAVNMDKSS